MFPSQPRLFKEIECPSVKFKQPCPLPHCIFTHPRRQHPHLPVQTTKLAQPVQVAAKRSQDEPTSTSPASKRKIVFAPAMLDSPPAQHIVRVRYLSVIRDKLEEAGSKDPQHKAIELEKQTAERSTAVTYAHNIRTTVREILRGDHNEGVRKAQLEKAAKSRVSLYREELAKLIIPLSALAKRYITEIPQCDDAEDLPIQFECDRCRTKFLVSDNKNAQCHFHLLRRNYNLEKKKLEDIYPCCGQQLGESNGCQTRSSHVYKLTEPTQLHQAVPFRTVPTDPQKPTWLFGAAIDCEMAYTTKGMELIRVTVIDWDTAKIVLDRTVLPFGEILDLNTRFSGISDINQGTDLDGVHYPTLGFDEALEAVFDFVGPHTILIGHGLENDLQTLRIVHNLVVDSAMLYPRQRTRTHSLKQLAWTYLSRNIQSGEHDSFEDALAAMDVVKADIAQRLKLK